MEKVSNSVYCLTGGVFCRYLPGGTIENYEYFQSGLPVTGRDFEVVNYGIR